MVTDSPNYVVRIIEKIQHGFERIFYKLSTFVKTSQVVLGKNMQGFFNRATSRRNDVMGAKVCQRC